ncbi:energy-coupling factor transporter transmembrane component T [Mycoplasma sp. ATU-Cv-508]|uniref:energy-coupling factor transporter transmembrane component T family protein n=1 Tax=Mycoplasma sp. ATU-Cv-508 TaxID=2048001 RepID=UPI001F3C2F13
MLLSSLKPVFAIGLFIFVINLFILGKTGHVGQTYGSWWKFTLSDRAIQLSLLIMIRIYIMILTTTLLTATTSPMALTRAIEDVLFPLRLVRIKVHIIALIIAIALRFIPTLLEEAQRIMKAQASRGVDFKNGNLKTKAKSLITLIIPLFVSAFTKADDLAYAMETRGYDPYEKRSRYRVYVPRWTDYLVVIFYAGMIALVVMFLNGQIPIPTWMS